MRRSAFILSSLATLVGALGIVLWSSADASKPALRLSEEVAVPGQVVTATGKKLKNVKVSIGNKKPRILSRSKRRVSFQTPRIKPGDYRVVFRTGKRRRSAPLHVNRGFTGELSIELESSRAASAEIGADGGKIAATGSNGTRYELTIPAGALSAPSRIMVTPIARAGGIPGGKSTRNGVQFAPDGLVFAKPSTLGVIPARPMGRPVGLLSSDDGTGVIFQRGERDGEAFSIEIPHFSTAATANMTLQDFENLLAHWASQPMTLHIAAQFYDMLPDFNHADFCDSNQTCQAVRSAARAFVQDFARNPERGGCGEAGESAFIHELEATVDLLYKLEADLQLLGEEYGGRLEACRAYLVGAMYRLIHDTVPTDPLSVSGPCSRTQVDIDDNGTVEEIECAVRVAGTANLQGFALTRSLVMTDIRDGLRKLLRDGKELCERDQNPRFEEGARLLVRGSQYAQALDDGAALEGLDGELHEALLECEPKVEITPAGPSMQIGETETFTATSEEPGDTLFSWSAENGTISRTISDSAQFTAPMQPGPVEIKATSSKPAWFPTTTQPNRVGKTIVVVSCPPGQFPYDPPPAGGAKDCRAVSVAISPESVALDPGEQQQFTATVSNANDTRVDWFVSAGGGSITTNGFYTAPDEAGSYSVTVASRLDPTKLATAVVSVEGPEPPPACSDGEDNDADTFVDAADPGCGPAGDTSEAHTTLTLRDGTLSSGQPVPGCRGLTDVTLHNGEGIVYKAIGPSYGCEFDFPPFDEDGFVADLTVEVGSTAVRRFSSVGVVTYLFRESPWEGTEHAWRGSSNVTVTEP